MASRRFKMQRETDWNHRHARTTTAYGENLESEAHTWDLLGRTPFERLQVVADGAMMATLVRTLSECLHTINLATTLYG